MKAGDDGEVFTVEDQEAMGIFWVHPKLWKHMPTSPISGEEMAWGLLKNFKRDVIEEDSDELAMSYAPSEEHQELKKLLVWLWMVANRVVKSATKGFDGAKEVDQALFEVGAKFKMPPEGTSASNPVVINAGGTANDTALRDAIQAMATVQEEVLKNQVKDRERKMMTHRYMDENEDLFRVLSAKDWNDTEPELT